MCYSDAHTRFSHLIGISKRILRWCKARRIIIFASYINSTDNKGADAESHKRVSSAHKMEMKINLIIFLPCVARDMSLAPKYNFSPGEHAARAVPRNCLVSLPKSFTPGGSLCLNMRTNPKTSTLENGLYDYYNTVSIRTGSNLKPYTLTSMRGNGCPHRNDDNVRKGWLKVWHLLLGMGYTATHLIVEPPPRIITVQRTKFYRFELAANDIPCSNRIERNRDRIPDSDRGRNSYRESYRGRRRDRPLQTMKEQPPRPRGRSRS
ncbi:hypothetical protein EVAR_64072_1 [Eumeta japonica]|uniref:Uncharacterized protein n=1 Tax=Eumeta variegata TaxID=151549 RepID=A0A4C1ZDG0_EUMVA|nr:hypothetical protein EVAR_64072_1 [Eumeta japonica]